MNNKEVFALVYFDFEGLGLLEMGDAEFIKQKYLEYKTSIEETEKKYIFTKRWMRPEEYWDEPFANMEVNRLCVYGYKDNEIGCVCKDFGIGSDEQNLSE
jgi:hypothetical protein